MPKRIFEENVYFRFAMSKEIENGQENTKVKKINNINI